ncbi:hypothetical protein TNCT_529581, partial [Trichonephila clavata]
MIRIKIVPATFPYSPYRSNQTMLTLIKCLRETGCVISRARSPRPAKLRRQIDKNE